MSRARRMKNPKEWWDEELGMGGSMEWAPEYIKRKKQQEIEKKKEEIEKPTLHIWQEKDGPTMSDETKTKINVVYVTHDLRSIFLGGICFKPPKTAKELLAPTITINFDRLAKKYPGDITIKSAPWEKTEGVEGNLLTPQIWRDIQAAVEKLETEFNQGLLSGEKWEKVKERYAELDDLVSNYGVLEWFREEAKEEGRQEKGRHEVNHNHDLSHQKPGSVHPEPVPQSPGS